MAKDKQLGEEIRRRVNEQILASLDVATPERKPDGIVTIAFTDVEDSSRLVQELGDRDARALLRQHDEVLREGVKSHDGTEVERAGDGFMLVFATASRAIESAVWLQRALADHDELARAGVRVRIGMQTGEVMTEEHGYFGRTVFQAARIADLARGGQIVVADPTRLIAGEDRFSFTDIGQHELRGLGTTHRLFEVSWA